MIYYRPPFIILCAFLILNYFPNGFILAGTGEADIIWAEREPTSSLCRRLARRTRFNLKKCSQL